MTWWRGGNFDQRSIDMLTEAERISGIPIVVTQGSYSGTVAASAGTHAGGGAVDLDVDGLDSDEIGRLIQGLRRVGWAAWLRTPAQGFAYHIHGIAVACEDLSSGAEYQVAEYFAGRNGLAGRGTDDGPRDFPGGVGVTWEDYLAATAAPTEPLAPPPPPNPLADPTEETDMAFLTEYSYGPGDPAGIVFALSADLSTKTHVKDADTLQNLITAGYKVIPLSKAQVDNAKWAGYDGQDPAAVVPADGRIASVIAALRH